MMLSIVWFYLLLLFLTAYCVFDGFDLGIGIVSLFTMNRERRNLLFNSIAPFWDGNELWLIIAGGSLFAVFPQAYATALSGFYLPVFLVAVCLILRAASFEMRHLAQREITRRAWEAAFGVSSLLIPVLLTVALANIVKGLPLNGQLDYTGSLTGLFGLYPCTLAIAGIALTLLHGSLFAAGKLPEPHAATLAKTAGTFWYAAVLLTGALVTVMSITLPGLRHSSPFMGTVLLSAAALVFVKVAHGRGLSRASFYGSSLAVIGVMLMQATALYPNLIRNSADPLNSITIFNSSSPAGTLAILTPIAIPAAICYLLLNRYLYRVFKARLTSDQDSFYGNGKEQNDAR